MQPYTAPAAADRPLEPVQTPKKSKKGALAVAGISLLLITLVAGYLVAVPAMKVSEQKKVNTTHKSVTDKLVSVYNSFKLDAFSKSDADTTKSKADVKVALDAIKDARTAIDRNVATLTKFEALPLLDWNTSYKTATTIDGKEEQYVKDARAFLDQYASLVDYEDKGLDIAAKLETAGNKLASITEHDTPAQMSAKMDAGAAELQTTIDEIKKMSVPSFVKEDHDKQLAQVEKLLTAFKDFSAATKKLDVEKVLAGETAITNIVNEGDALSKAATTKLQRDSVISKGIDRLRDLNDEITGLYGKL